MFYIHSTLDVERLDVKRFTDRMQISCSSDSMLDAQKGCMCEYYFNVSEKLTVAMLFHDQLN